VELGERIKLWRKARGLTQQDLAETCDITVSAVSLWESGGGISQKHLALVVDLFGVSMERFYGRVPKARAA
jgi:transcriptional regulator with XRE-family HTH domain